MPRKPDPLRIVLSSHQRAVLARWSEQTAAIARDKSVFLTAIIAGKVDPQTVQPGTGALVDVSDGVLSVTYPEIRKA